jgi:hypothetical protein
VVQAASGRIMIHPKHETNLSAYIHTPLLFLDIDGVLNCETNLMNSDTPMVMDGVFVNRLAEIIKQTCCKVVISSTWRHFGLGPDSQFQIALKKASPESFDVIMESIIGITPCKMSFIPRDAEIKMWFEYYFWEDGLEHKGKWVVLDDNNLSGEDDYFCKDHFVKTEFRGDSAGLNEDKMNEIIQRLK